VVVRPVMAASQPRITPLVSVADEGRPAQPPQGPMRSRTDKHVRRRGSAERLLCGMLVRCSPLIPRTLSINFDLWSLP